MCGFFKPSSGRNQLTPEMFPLIYQVFIKLFSKALPTFEGFRDEVDPPGFGVTLLTSEVGLRLVELNPGLLESLLDPGLLNVVEAGRVGQLRVRDEGRTGEPENGPGQIQG